MAEKIINLKFKHPFTARIIGPSGAGKTFFLRKFLEQLDNFTVDLPYKRVVWAHGQPQAVHKVPIKGCHVTYVEGLPSEEEIEQVKPSILVLDDLAIELEREKRLAKIFTKESHHSGRTCLMVQQNLYLPGPIMRTVSLNSHHDILFNSPRDARQIMTYASQLRPRNTVSVTEAYDDCVKQPRGYMIVNLRGDVPDKCRIMTRIFIDELPDKYKAYKFLPIVYVPKKK